MDKRAMKRFFTNRGTVWTLSLCMTGVLVLGGIAAVDRARRTNEKTAQTESELGRVAYLEEEITETPDESADRLFPTLEDAPSDEDLAQASGSAVEEPSDGLSANDGLTDGETAVDEPADGAQEASGETMDDAESAGGEESGAETADGTDGEAAEAASGSVISEQALIEQGIQFTDAGSLMWPAAGTILIDYSMDGSVYFPTLNQYKYNPALIIGSDEGNQVLAAAKGMVESVTEDEETGTTVVMNIGNGFRLTYGQLREVTAAEGDVLEQGAILGYVSKPTKYYSEEGSNLYFQMTQDGAAVDPVLYFE